VQRFYFDHNATTPVSPEVLEVYLPVLLEVHGNASSIHHDGQIAKQKLETARRQTAELLGSTPREIVFVSGGTEANNLAVFGISARHIVTTAIEHPALLNPCAELETRGIAVTYLPVDSSGIVDPDDVRRAIRPDTGLISIMHVNNEIGTIQPVEEISRIAKEAGIPMHSDGVQAAGRLPVDLNALGVDMYSLSAHKMYAPKGVGALYVRKGTKLSPILYGGRHEQQRRAGTENVPGAVALGAAASWLGPNLAEENTRLAELRDRLEQGVLDRIPAVSVNGSRASRSPATTNLCFDGIEGESLVIALDLKGFAVSSGSACSSGAVEPSHVLTAIGLPSQKAKSSLRFSLGRSNTVEQVDVLIDAISASVAHLRRLSPSFATHV
jgi:cysteine desulfurase